MTNKIDLVKYKQFVNDITSNPSKDYDAMMARFKELHDQGANVPRLLTSSVGLGGESGEFNEIIKKILFHGKAYNEENIAHLKKELGDVIWYWTQACLALNVDPNEIISDNVTKLQSRHPNGSFDPYYMANRDPNDV
jgi:NTP pyrophosphatase (non-canonical NTP hydrolase)